MLGVDAQGHLYTGNVQQGERVQRLRGAPATKSGRSQGAAILSRCAYCDPTTGLLSVPMLSISQTATSPSFM